MVLEYISSSALDAILEPFWSAQSCSSNLLTNETFFALLEHRFTCQLYSTDSIRLCTFTKSVSKGGYGSSPPARPKMWIFLAPPAQNDSLLDWICSRPWSPTSHSKPVSYKTLQLIAGDIVYGCLYALHDRIIMLLWTLWVGDMTWVISDEHGNRNFSYTNTMLRFRFCLITSLIEKFLKPYHSDFSQKQMISFSFF